MDHATAAAVATRKNCSLDNPVLFPPLYGRRVEAQFGQYRLADVVIAGMASILARHHIRTGGTRAGTAPTDESTWRQLSRPASCGWSMNCWTVLRRALAIWAVSRRSSTSDGGSAVKTRSISAYVCEVLHSQVVAEIERHLRDPGGRGPSCRTWPTRGRSGCRRSPLCHPAACTPYGAMVAWLVCGRSGPANVRDIAYPSTRPAPRTATLRAPCPGRSLSLQERCQDARMRCTCRRRYRQSTDPPSTVCRACR